MNLDSLATYLFSEGNVSELGDTTPKMYIYEANAEDHSDRDIFALLLPSLTGMPTNVELPNYHRGQIQLITTAKDVDDGRRLAETLSDDLTLNRAEFDDMTVLKCLPKHLPIFYRRNEQGMLEHSVNFDITIILKK